MTDGVRRSLAIGGSLLVLPLAAVVALRTHGPDESLPSRPPPRVVEAPLPGSPGAAPSIDSEPKLDVVKHAVPAVPKAAGVAPIPRAAQLDTARDSLQDFADAPVQASGPMDIDRPVITDMGSLARAGGPRP